jgi:ParB family chromosome partitioning protein
MSKTAIDAPRGTLFKPDPDDLIIIGIDTNDGPEHPLYDVTFRHEIHEGMVLSILDIGVKEPVIVKKDGERVLVVDGRRRVINAREAKRRAAKRGEPGTIRVPVVLEKGSDEQMERVSATLNYIRLDDTTLDKAERVARMLRRNGGDYAEVAIAIGATEKTVRTYEQLVNLPSKVKKAVSSGQISPTAAVKLSDLPKDKMEETLDGLIAKSGGKKVSTSTVTRTRKTANGGIVAPKKSLLNKLVAHTVKNRTELDPEFMRGVRFVMGDLDPAAVKGLKGLLAEL